MENKRTLTEHREDRRVRRTKRLLEEGLIQLLKEKPLKAITVRELTNRIDINRGTFYLYYRDIYDMVDKIEEDYFARLMQMIEMHENKPLDEMTAKIIGDLMSFIQNNKDICQILAGDHGDISFIRKCNSVIREKCWKEWQKRWKTEESVFGYEYSFGTFGIWGIIRAWLENDCRESAEQIAILTTNCIRRGILPSESASTD